MLDRRSGAAVLHDLIAPDALYGQLKVLQDQKRDKDSIEAQRKLIRAAEQKLKFNKERLRITIERSHPKFADACKATDNQSKALSRRGEIIARIEGKPSAPRTPSWIGWQDILNADK